MSEPRNPKMMNKKADSGVAVNAVVRATVAVISRSTPVFSATPSIVID